ncbi:lysozyme [Xanthomonas sp. LMG 8993]|uniref:lysozyme n=1 Tax=Xanthomonas TaxID=338 RepID=UPI001367DFD7|nr:MULTISPECIES: lysozyme [Xanthomonas]MBB4768640.1 lysozyme [Xanthomonas arboricola]MXV46561.1 lysozyme [Xanthomonas sp. LMG 8993]
MIESVRIATPLTKVSEGLRLRAYVCPAGKLTIGWGHTGTDVKPGMTITQERAEQLLEADLNKALAGVRKHVRVPLTAHQEAALVDFVFNLGASNLATSTLLRKLNRKDYKSVSAELGRWVYGKVNGKSAVLPGLVARRRANVALWETKL